MTRRSLRLVWAILVVFMAATTAWAEPKVARLRVALTESAAESTKVFPLGTEQIFILFDYDGLANQQISVRLTSPSGLELFRQAERLSGKGAKSIAVGGADIYRNLADLMVTSLVQVQTNAGLVMTQQAGQKEFLSQVLANVLTAKSVAQTMSKLPLGDSLRAERAALDKGLTDLEKRADEARLLPADRINDMKAAGTDIKKLAEGLVAPAKAVQDAAKAATKTPLPESGVDARTTYVAQVEINSDPADSVEFQVSNEKPLPPTLEPTRPPRVDNPGGSQPTSASGQRATATTAPSQAGAAATNSRGGAQPVPSAVAVSGAGVSAVASPARAGAGSDATGRGTPATNASAVAGQLQPPSGATSDAGVSSGGSEAVATWTPMPGAVALGRPAQSSAGSGDASVPAPPAAPSGTNFGVLALGALVLVGVAAWLRRRGL